VDAGILTDPGGPIQPDTGAVAEEVVQRRDDRLLTRVGQAVRHPRHPWSAATRALLEHLSRAGFMQSLDWLAPILMLTCSASSQALPAPTDGLQRQPKKVSRPRHDCFAGTTTPSEIGVLSLNRSGSTPRSAPETLHRRFATATLDPGMSSGTATRRSDYSISSTPDRRSARQCGIRLRILCAIPRRRRMPALAAIPGAARSPNPASDLRRVLRAQLGRRSGRSRHCRPNGHAHPSSPVGRQRTPTASRDGGCRISRQTASSDQLVIATPTPDRPLSPSGKPGTPATSHGGRRSSEPSRPSDC